MNPQPHPTQEELFARAAALAGKQREAFLQQACGQNQSLRSELDSLLAAHDAAADFLHSPPIADPFAGEEFSQREMPIPEKIAGYSIIRLLGVGGMGTVYLARQEGTSREVALKVMRPGYASASLRRRFDHEARILARLHHPGIAQVYEAGLAEQGGGPQPFFAMELVEGEPLDIYASRAALSVPARLELMAVICDAVEHAHQRGVIHRDLKPANVLVDGQGRPRILDFGVARATAADAPPTMQTLPGQLIGTPAYMSPEQISGNPAEVDGRCDVYALGVMLYELLAGQLPHDADVTPLPELLRRVREQEARPLGTVKRQYRGDIETIVRKAMEKEVGRRYQSAAALAEDIRRFLRDEAISARPPTMLEQARRFTRRNRVLVGAGAAVFAALVLLVVGVSVGLVRAVAAERIALAEREAARIEALRAQEVSRFLDEMLASVDPQLAGTADTTLLRRILDAAAARADDLSGTPQVEATVRMTIGGTYMFAGLHAAAEDHLARAHALRAVELGADHPQTLEAGNRLAVLHFHRGRYEEAERLYREVLDGRRRSLGDDDPATLESINNLGALLLTLGRLREGEVLCIEAVEGRRRVLGSASLQTLESMNNLAGTWWLQQRHAEAEALWMEILEATMDTAGPEHPSTLRTMKNLAMVQSSLGRVAEALPLVEQMLEVQRAVMGEEHLDTLRTKTQLADTNRELGRDEDAERLYLEVLDAYTRHFGDGHLSALDLMQNLASLYLATGRSQAAESLMTRAVEGARASQLPSSSHMARYLAGRAITCAAQGKYAEAEADLLEAHGLLGDSADPATIMFTLETLVALYDAMGQADDAAAWRARTSEIMNR